VKAQTSDCAFYIESDQTRKQIRQSFYPLNFSVTDNMVVMLKINDKGSPNTIELILDFEDESGLPTELGSMLSIKFIDGTSNSIIARTKKANTSIIYFTLNETGSKDDPFMIEKLSKNNIRALVIIADYKQREILIPETKAAILKKIILCLSDN